MLRRLEKNHLKCRPSMSELIESVGIKKNEGPLCYACRGSWRQRLLWLQAFSATAVPDLILGKEWCARTPSNCVTSFIRRPALIALMLCLAAFSTVVQAVRADDVQKRFALSAQAFPNQEKFLYIDVPSAGNGVSNALIRGLIGNAQWMHQLTDVMARGAQSPTYLVVGSGSDSVAYSALRKALDSFKGRLLPQLHVALIGDLRQAERLRPTVEALGAEYRVLSSSSSSE